MIEYSGFIRDDNTRAVIFRHGAGQQAFPLIFPTGFHGDGAAWLWGSKQSGCLALAYALLTHAAGATTAEMLAAPFVLSVISGWKLQSWSVTRNQVRERARSLWSAIYPTRMYPPELEEGGDE